MGLILFIVLLILSIYHPWLAVDKTLSSGDWPYLFIENIKEFSFLPSTGTTWLTPYYQITAKIFVEYLGLSWNFTEKLFWFWPYLLFSFFSSRYLAKSLIPESNFKLLTPLIFLLNTYALMLVGGGQMGVALAYSIAPLVLAKFLKLINLLSFSGQNIKYQISNIKYLIIMGMVLAVQTMFDPRIAYITVLAVLLYLLISFFSSKKVILAKLLLFLIPIIIALLLNSFWIISLLKYGFPKGLEGYSSLLGFQFLSFADFPHAFSILHPNWPENIFGKVYFMKAEFILLPILAYSSLLFLKRSKIKDQRSDIKIKNQKFNNNGTIEQYNNKNILFFAFLGLVGSFLAKGSNPPLGEVNEFLFQYFPGMGMFRDATKFYTLTILSYSVLIPFTVKEIYQWLQSKKNFQFSTLNPSASLRASSQLSILLFLFTFLYLLFLIRPALMGQLSGTFKPREIPKEYLEFKNFLNNQQQFFKILWLPQKQRFGFASSNHPSINVNELFKTNSIFEITKELKKDDVLEKLREDSVKYIVVPYDSEREIFLKDRKYNEEEHIVLIKELNSLSSLQKIPSFDKIGVFEIK